MKIGIIVPSGDMVHADFAICLARIIAWEVSNNQIVVINSKSSIVQKGRYDGVRQALDIGCDKILFIDSDQTFPHDALSTLLKDRKKIVTATCKMRNGVDQYTARDFNGNRIDFSQRKGLHEVASNGFPFALIDAEVFRKVPEPWFTVTFDNGRWIGEDESFFHAARKAGYKVWVNADLTKQIGHLGTKEYI